MSDLLVARCVEREGTRARFEIVSIHPDAMGRRRPFSIGRLFVLDLLFDVCADLLQVKALKAMMA